ncbi:MAG TPA: STAS domain-containing protein [Actinocrinis sp.]|nr:STAS domain-containing protein [Actinocrinis sp.]
MDRFSTLVQEHGPERFVVAVTGELDLAQAEQLKGTLEPLLTSGALVVLDAGAMTFMDSSGLRTLLYAASRAKAEGAVFRLAAALPAVSRVLELSGMVDTLDARADVPAALAD